MEAEFSLRGNVTNGHFNFFFMMKNDCFIYSESDFDAYY